MSAAMTLAWRMLARDWRAGELGVLAVALVIAVASVTSVGFFADRVGRALARDAHQLLGADLVLVSDHPWAGDMARTIASSGAQHAEALSFISMALKGEESQLAGVKAVSERYPLRGRLRIAPAPGAEDAEAQGIPRPGSVWIEERLVSTLHAPVGSRIRLGRSDFEVAAVITLEPERSAGFFNLAPRILMNIADVPATALVQTGSRVSYFQYAAGSPRQMSDLENVLNPRLGRGERIETLESGRPEIRAAVERAQRFLGLTALLAAVLAGVAIALSARRFVERHLDGVAVMRCLGATQRQLLRLYAAEFALLGTIACALGAALGYAAQAGLGAALAGVIRAELPLATGWPAVHGALVGLALLLGFALPPLVQLKNVPALRVMRREMNVPRPATLASYGAGFATVCALLVWQAGDLRLGAYVVGGFAAALAVFFVTALAALTILSRLKMARQLRRHLRANAVQTAALALGLAALLLLTFTRNDLVDAWRRSAPPDAPNRFLIGVQPEQVSEIRQFLGANGVQVPEIYPMVRGRLVAVNGAAVNEADYADERSRRLVEREFNLSYLDELPSHNAIAAGRWLDPQRAEVSAEQGIAERLGWKLGDELTFAVGGERFTARLTSLRRLRWDSMKVNFFVIATPKLLERFPTSFISAFRVPPGHEALVSELAARFPNVTVLDVGAMLRQAQAMVDQLVHAVQFIFVFAMGAGLLVLYCALAATEDERRREAAVMRVFGASRSQVARRQRAEFLAMGLVAGVLAALGAAVIGELLAQRVFDIDLPANAALWLSGPLAGLALLSLNAWLSARKVLAAPPALTLRDSV
ncbi:MAG TPA: FtsX-like permease family protein [Burkholderiales bacterium]|jgi:putative ABC transport system permease protein|nr:FtsX-like permease family protein [Burkholderiales bacterium]